MPVRRSLKIFIRCAVLTVALLLVVPSEQKDLTVTGNSDPGHSLYAGTVRCAIDLQNDAAARGLEAGFNYELLKLFGRQHGCEMDIRVARRGESYADSLALGAIDILVTYISDDPADIAKSRNVDRASAWYLQDGATEEMQDVNLWLNSFIGTKEYKDLRTRFHRSYNPITRLSRGSSSSHILSPYDDLVRKGAATLGWDWRMLLALIYQESGFSIGLVSRRGAMGLMQIMPSTGLKYGVTDLVDPEQNIIAGTRFLARIQKMFPASEFSPEERVKFTLAAYNAGEGRILDCRLVARSKDLDDTVWDNIVQVIPDMRSYTVSLPDSTATRSGSFIGRETINHVTQVLAYYDAFCRLCPDR
ncbi:MAG: transglycosylase SLT domain-containing protein [Bacteroidales bacterium]|nr:transglycosylase SLT domain-containing protein [Bacteroidales bacterium]